MNCHSETSVRSTRCRVYSILLFLMVSAGMILASTNSVEAAKLTRPTMVNFSSKNRTYVNITWAKVKSAKSYVVYKYDGKSKSFKKLAVVKGKTSYKATGLKEATNYKFQIRSAKTASGTGCSNASKTLSVTTYKKKYTITPATTPIDERMLRFGFYNSKTKNYYTLRSCMEAFEKMGGGTLTLKKGTYTITNCVYVPSNVTIKLESGAVLTKGQDTGNKKLKPSNSMFHLIRPSKGDKKGAVGGYNGEKNIKFIGSGSATVDMKSQKNCNAFEAGHNNGITFDKINFKNIDGGHFIELDATKNATITNCTFNKITGQKVETREAINLDTPDKITGGFTAVWSNYDCTANNTVLIENCKFTNMGRAIGTHNYSTNHPHKNVTIRNCVMKNINSYGIGMMNWEGVTITGNKIVGTSSAIGNKRAAILGKGVKAANITGNTLAQYYYGMLFQQAVDDTSKHRPSLKNALTASEIKLLNDNTKGYLKMSDKRDCDGYYRKSTEFPVKLYFD